MKLLFRAAVLSGVLGTVAGAQRAAPAWPQWGGPDRNFVVQDPGLASSWPASGPRQLWTRALGQGHSAITVDGGRLYTLYRPAGPKGHSDEEVLAALDQRTGATVWEFRFPSPMDGAHFGPYVGPHSTPLLTADRVYAAGSRKQVLAIDKATGRLLWSHDLIREYGAPEGDRGYAASPLLYKHLLIVPVGGAGQTLAAFDAASGALVWKTGQIDQSPGSPILIDVDGQPQVVYFGGNAIGGFDPLNGRPRWSHPHRTSASLNISTPVWSPSDRLLFLSSAYGHGSRMLEVRRPSDRTEVTERWFNNRLRIHFSNAVRVAQQVVAVSGDFGPAALTGVDARSGEIVWQDRGFTRAQLLKVGDKLLTLEEDGILGLLALSPGGVKVLAKARVLENPAWTPPTLVGTTVFVRDRKTIAAYDLGR